MGFGMWIFWLAVILLIVVIVKAVMTDSATRNREDDALEILNKRYARGEIDEIEYERRKNELENK